MTRAAFARRAGRQMTILRDLPGPKLGTGELADDLAELTPGDVVTFVRAQDGVGDVARMSYRLARPADSSRAIRSCDDRSACG